MEPDKPSSSVGLSAAKRALLEKRLRGTPVASAAAIGPRPESAGMPLSYAQQRLWLASQMQPDSALYNVPVAVRLEGVLNVEALAQSLDRIVSRHDVLRTVFATVDGSPMAVLRDGGSGSLAVEDLRALPESAREAEALNRMQIAARQPFDLARGPLYRFTLFTLAPERHVLFLCLHHLVSDAWSLVVMLRELAELYDALSGGQASQGPALPIQYADYAHWQREWLKGDVLERQLDYWQRALSGLTPALDLPFDHARPAQPSMAGATMSFELPAALSAAVNALAQRSGATPFMVLLAALQTLLQRYTRQDDIAIGTPIAGRNRREIEGLIGFFVNTLVLRGDLSDDPTFAELLTRTRDNTLGAYAHQDLPFERVVDALRTGPSAIAGPLFQVMLILQNVPWEQVSLTGLRWNLFTVESGTSKFDLTLALVERDGRFEGQWEYSSELFEPDTVARLGRHFVAVLAAALAEPERRLSELAWLDEAEHRQLVAAEDATAADYPRDAVIHQLFEAQVRRSPSAEAVSDGATALTYADLNRRANQLAYHLRALGVTTETVVGVCLPRSLEAWVALMAVLKAGGAFVPLDPAYPTERLAYMLTDSRAAVLITESSQLARFSSPDAAIVCVDQDRAAIDRQPGDDLEDRTTADQPAYVIYTSGSTGQPKGVVGLHRGAINRFAWMWRTYPFAATERCCQKTALSFVDSIWELFGPLLQGVASVIIPDEAVRDPQLLVDWLARERVTRLVLVPSLLRALLDRHPDLGAQLPDLAFWVCSGEALPIELVRRFREAAPGHRLLNLYGSSEVAADATAYEVPDGDLPRTIPIGRPIANTRALVLDDRRRPVPIGVIGELYIGGDNLARGYLGRPELTAERFVSDPYSTKPNQRLFRTGDLARVLPDGTLEYVGRRDLQVKIRGVRVELEEVEHAVRQLPGVDACAVVAREVGPGDVRLVAYVSSGAGGPPDVADLRERLLARLPAPMVPSAFVVLKALPLTPNGKLDRRALPQPVFAHMANANDVDPSTPTEIAVAGIWAAVLGLPQVSANASFFDLGGHSLLAMQVLARVWSGLGVKVPLRQLLDHPTVADLARYIDAATPDPTAGRHETAGAYGEAPLSATQRGLWYLSRVSPESPAYNLPLGVRIRGPLDADALERALQHIVQRHAPLRTSFHVRAGAPVQVVAGEVSFGIDRRDVIAGDGETIEAAIQRLAAEETTRPFDLERAPLIRACLLRLADADHVLVVTIHHIVADGWSINQIMAPELGALYPAFAAGKTASLPELKAHYADFVTWQQAWLAGDAENDIARYWLERVRGSSQPLELPFDRPRPALETQRGEQLTFSLPAALTARLTALSQKENVTLFTTLLSALYILLYRYTGQMSPVVGATVAGRAHAEFEDVIGLFVNTLALRADVTGDDTARGLIRRVRNVVIDAHAHQELPFERLVELVQAERGARGGPLVQVMFAYQELPTAEESLADLQLEPLMLHTATSKFDLTLSATHRQGTLNLGFEYATELFDAVTIERMTGHFRAILESLVADPDAAVSTLRLLTDEERRQLVVDRNTAPRAYDSSGTLAARFAAQARHTPDAIALTCEGRHLTYRDLDERANQLAHYLQAQGIAPDRLVALCLERSLDMVVAILAVLKSGGAYLPLDLAYPTDRLAFMLEDAHPSVLIAHTHLADRLPTTDALVFWIDNEWPQIAGLPTEAPMIATQPDDLAYVIYTSGSTGKPKGVMVTQANVIRLLTATEHWYHFNAADVWSLFHSYAFDVSVWEIWGALLNGGRLVVVPYETSRNPHAFCDLLRDEGVTVLCQTPSAFKPLMRVEVSRSTPPTDLALRYIIFAGEALDFVSLRPWFDRHGDERPLLVNMYGITETTVHSTFRTVQLPDLEGSAPSLIGWPIPDLQIYVLDQHRQPVPHGVIGELYVGGAGVARGYLNRAALNAERFLPDPFRPGGTLYKSGDLARFRSNGDLEYLGRIDHQVKIRGFRVELGEIEAALSSHPDVREAAVLAREDTPGEKRLVAYLLPTGEVWPTTRELRAHLLTTLPDYMVPAAFVWLEAFPLTPNGKLDRRALPAPSQQMRVEAPIEPVDLPATPTEVLIAGVWRDILKVEPIRVQDNFFDLGGHSLSSIQVIDALAEKTGVKLSPAYVRLQTLGQLAAMYDEKQARPTQPDVAPKPEPSGRVLGRLKQVFSREKGRQP